MVSLDLPNELDGCLGALLAAADQRGTSIIRCNRDLRYAFANDSYAELLGQPVEHIVGHSMPVVMGDAAFRVIRPYVDRVLARERVEYEAEIPFTGVGLRRVHAIHIPGFDLRGAVCGWVAAIELLRRWRPRADPVACASAPLLLGAVPFHARSL